MEKQKKEEPGRSGAPRTPARPINPHLWLLLIAFFVLLVLFLSNQQQGVSDITYSFFLEQIEEKNIIKVQLAETKAYGVFKEPPPAPPDVNLLGEPIKRKPDEKLQKRFAVDLSLSGESRAMLEQKLLESGAIVDNMPPSDSAQWLTLFAAVILPIGLFVFLFIMFRRAQNQLMGGGFLSGFSKSPAKRYEPDKRPVTFKDVAGLEGVKADLQEIVDFLKDAKKFQRLGGRVPKGVLLNGPPGTGKTLLARAIAGEAGVPFYSVSGSEFIQMFVGVGASRVRDLFNTARENAPAIIFIDEIDAVGRQRGAGLGGGHDEREQTLNQILSEMDGFEVNETVIVFSATNRPDVLDPALLRPGRFDRHITVDRPSLRGREEILKVHVRDVPLAEDVNLRRIAEGTTGLTGADLRNIVNEAALWATRQDHDKVYMRDFEHAIDKVLMGPKREEVLQGKEKEKTAYHEAGHALVAWLTEGVERVHKVTVVPRGRALGVTQMVPEEDRFNITQEELNARLAYILGGRAAEHLVYGQYSAGAENDLERATNIARRMVAQWGMSERLGPVSYKMSDEDPFLGREIHQQRHFSEHTLQVIDEEVARILHEAEARAEKTLRENRAKLDTLVKGLLENEVLSESEIVELIGPAARDTIESNGKAEKDPFAKKTSEEDKALVTEDDGDPP